MKNSDILVIGAGIGGIATAANLARRGYRVRVIEKNKIPGGRCGFKEVQGHTFDTGPTLYLMPELYRKAFSELGESIEDHLDLVRVDPTYNLHFADGLDLELSSDLNHMKNQLERIEPGCFDNYLDYLGEGYNHYHLSLPNIVTRQFITAASFFTLRNLSLLIRLKALKRHYRNIGNYFNDERPKFSFIFQNLYMGLDPYKAPAIYSMMPFTELTDGVWYPKGGMYSITKALVNIAENHGVEFEYESRVSKINIKRNKVVGIEFADGRKLPADLVIANADLNYVYQNLLPQNGTAKHLSKKKYGCSALTFFWGLDNQYPQLGPHNLFLEEDIRGGFEQIFNSLSISSTPSFYVHAPVRVDPILAPEGHDTLVISVPVPHIDENNPQDWERISQTCREYILTRFESLGITDSEDHIKFEFVYTPEDWKKRYNLTKGSAHGLGHELLQMGYMRPANVHKRYKNLYFVGASTHPGTGLPSVLTSSKFVTDRIIAEN